MNRSAILTGTMLLAACQQNTGSESRAPAAEDRTPLIAADASQCPEADQNGRILIAKGLEATILNKGYGRVAVLGDQVTVGAELWVHDEAAEGGKGAFVWDAGTDGFAFEIGSGSFIEGWAPGVACMRLGEQRELIIASELAYGERGRAPIPPNADIIYELELLSIAEPVE